MRPLVILQGTRGRSQIAYDAGKILCYALGRVSLSPREHCIFEYVHDGPLKEIPTRKKDRASFLPADVEALCSRLAARSLWDPLREIYVRGITRINHRGPALDRLIKSLPPSGVVGLGSVACEVLSGRSRISMFSDCEWETLPCFQRIGIRKAWITLDPIMALMDAGLLVDLCGTLAHAAMDIGLPVKALGAGEYRGPNVLELWEDYESLRGNREFTQYRKE